MTPAPPAPTISRVRSAFVFGACAALAVLAAMVSVAGGGVLALFLPLLAFLQAGVAAGLSLRRGRLVAATVAAGGMGAGFLSMLAVVSTQAWSGGPGFVVGLGLAFGVVWVVTGLFEAAAILTIMRGVTRAPWTTAILQMPTTLALGGILGGAVCGLGLDIVAVRNPVGVVLIGLSFVIPCAVNGAVLAHTLSPARHE